jgi:hypothetical protein
MTEEERVRMKWLCLLIHEEKNDDVFDRLVKELVDVLAATPYVLRPLPQERANSRSAVPGSNPI